MTSTPRSANRVGVAHLAVLAGSPFDEIVDYGERCMRRALASVPDGSWSFADELDATDTCPPTPIVVCVTKVGDEVTFDFTGTDTQGAGNVNAVEAVTVSAVGWALRTSTVPLLPANGGAFPPVRVVAPNGTVIAARWPAAVRAGNVEVSQRVADLCLGALAQALPERVPAAGQGTMNNLMIGGPGWVYYETVAGGQGGRPAGPGTWRPARHEWRLHRDDAHEEHSRRSARALYPMRVLAYGLRRGSGGSGSAQGDDGIARDVELLVEATISLVTERRTSQPWGLGGGAPGASGENWLLPGGDESLAQRLPGVCTIDVQAGDVIRTRAVSPTSTI